MTDWLSSAELFGHVARPDFSSPLRIRTERCACGGTVTANVDDPGPSLLLHYETGKHKAWAIRVGVDWSEEA